MRFLVLMRLLDAPKGDCYTSSGESWLSASNGSLVVEKSQETSPLMYTGRCCWLGTCCMASRVMHGGHGTVRVLRQRSHYLSRVTSLQVHGLFASPSVKVGSVAIFGHWFLLA